MSYVPILRNSTFGFKERDVVEIAEQVKIDYSRLKTDLFHENIHFRRSAQSALAGSKRSLAALNDKSPEEVLLRLKQAYDAVRELGESGQKDPEISEKIYHRFPDLGDYYPLLRRKSWGYRLGSRLFSARVDEDDRLYDSKPIDISDAAKRILVGQKVEVTSEMLPGDDKWRTDLRERTQHEFDRVAKITDLKGGFDEHQYVVSETLRGITDRQFVFDLEDTAMNYVANLEHPSDRVFFADPYMHEVVMELARNDNFVMFWTSVPNSNLRKMQAVMPREMAALPAVGRDDWRGMAETYIKVLKGQVKDSEAVASLQLTMPFLNIEGYLRGKDIFMMYNIPTLQSYFKDPEEFLRHIKYPQIFISPDNGFFVDDNRSFIETAIRSGWPKDRVHQCDIRATKQRAEKTAMAIRRAFIS